jgi:hypothetical protein
MRASSAMYGRSIRAPSAQLSPIANGRAWRTLFQKAPTVWPDNVLPDWSVIVPLTTTGTRKPMSSKRLSTAKIAALPLSVSKIVSIWRMSAPPATRPRAAAL